MLNGNIVKFLRTMQGIDQRTLSKGTGLSQPLISMIESSCVPISKTSERRLREYFGLTDASILQANNLLHMSKGIIK